MITNKQVNEGLEPQKQSSDSLSLDEELNMRISQLSDQSNQGEPLKTKDYYLLFLIGLVVPIILLGIGWLL